MKKTDLKEVQLAFNDHRRYSQRFIRNRKS